MAMATASITTPTPRTASGGVCASSSSAAGASRSVVKVATSGRSGLQRSAIAPPASPPKPKALISRPHAGAPPRSRSTTSGPSTKKAAKARLPKAKAASDPTSQRRLTTSRHPSARSPMNEPCSAAGKAGMARRSRKMALTAKLAASMAKIQPAPITATTMPATIGPAMCAVLCDRFRRALPACSRDGLMVCGMRPMIAGPKKADAAPLTRAPARKTHSSPPPVRIATARPAWTAARMTSEPTMSSRRGTRSAHTPPTSRNSTRGTMKAAITKPRSAAESLMPSTAKTSATPDSASPAADVVWPIQSRRKLGSTRGPNRFSTPPPFRFDVE